MEASFASRVSRRHERTTALDDSALGSDKSHRDPLRTQLVREPVQQFVGVVDGLLRAHAPRPAHVLSVETIDMPQADRDPAMIEALHTDLARRFPANFAGM